MARCSLLSAHSKNWESGTRPSSRTSITILHCLRVFGHGKHTIQGQILRDANVVTGPISMDCGEGETYKAISYVSTACVDFSFCRTLMHDQELAIAG
jgi:hypothetical protein